MTTFKADYNGKKSTEKTNRHENMDSQKTVGAGESNGAAILAESFRFQLS